MYYAFTNPFQRLKTTHCAFLIGYPVFGSFELISLKNLVDIPILFVLYLCFFFLLNHGLGCHQCRQALASSKD
jgi:hypothetical protein